MCGVVVGFCVRGGFGSATAAAPTVAVAVYPADPVWPAVLTWGVVVRARPDERGPGSLRFQQGRGLAVLVAVAVWWR